MADIDVICACQIQLRFKYEIISKNCSNIDRLWIKIKYTEKLSFIGS